MVCAICPNVQLKDDKVFASKEELENAWEVKIRAHDPAWGVLSGMEKNRMMVCGFLCWETRTSGKEGKEDMMMVFSSMRERDWETDKKLGLRMLLKVCDCCVRFQQRVGKTRLFCGQRRCVDATRVCGGCDNGCRK